MAILLSYLSFNGNCKEAMSFYQECLGGTLELRTIGESPVAGQFPDSEKEKIMHGELRTHHGILFGSDMEQNSDVLKGRKVSLFLKCDSVDEIEDLYHKFLPKSKVVDPLKKQFWGGTFGILDDEFGMTWMFECD